METFEIVEEDWTLASLHACGGYWEIIVNPQHITPESDYTNNTAIFPN